MSRRADQVAALIHRAVQSVISQDLADPRLEALITVIGVNIDEALSEAVVRVSILPESKQELAFHGLKDAAGHIRRIASDAIELKRFPKLIFRLDSSLKKEAALLQAMSGISEERESTDEPSPTTDTANRSEGSKEEED